MRTGIAFALTILLVALAYALSVARMSGPPPAQAELIPLSNENWEGTVPEGKEVDAILGDFVLRNEHLIAVIAQPLETRHANMTVRDVGGCLIDLTTRTEPSDQLSAFYPGRRSYPYREARFAAGDGQGPVQTIATLPATGVTGSDVRLSVVAESTANRPAVTTTYRLSAGAQYLEVITTYTNRGTEPQTVELEDDLRVDGSKEDQARVAAGLLQSYWIHDRFWRQAYGIDAPGKRLDLAHGPGGTSFRYVDDADESRQRLGPGESITLTRRIVPGRDAWEVRSAQASNFGATPLVPVTITVHDQKRLPIAHARIDLTRNRQEFGSALVNAEGVLERALPPGDYEARVVLMGNTLADRLPLSVETDTRALTLSVDALPFGAISGQITDAEGRPIAAKIEFQPTAPQNTLNFGPETGEFALKNLVYVPRGQFTQRLPADQYKVTISHGPEYEIHQAEVTITPGNTTTIATKLTRTVDTTGWVSSDFHSHSSPSGDNTSSQLGRVLNLVCEHIEFAPCTEHNTVSSYDERIARLGVGQQLATVSGIELTGYPLPLNHQNAFPMRRTPRTQNGGGPSAEALYENQIEKLALWDQRSEKLIQVNHPDLGWMFHDRNGDGQVDAGFDRAFPWLDVIEIHPIDAAWHRVQGELRPGAKGNNRIIDWLQLLNQGYRYAGVVNTDAHYNFHGSGWLRNWIRSATDDPAKIDPQAMMRAAKRGQMVMSNGPFVEVWATAAGEGRSAAVSAGDDLLAPQGTVQLKVKVQAPTWIAVDRVLLLVNGRPHPQHDYQRSTTPDAFRGGNIRFERELTVELKEDAHLIVIAGSEHANLTQVWGKEYGAQMPTAISNPIYVDTDRNGFQANQDRLGYPLSVKQPGSR